MRRVLPVFATGCATGAPVPLGDLALRMPGLTRRMTVLHGALLLRAQQGALARWFGAEILVLETIGRRSGKVRMTPLVYVARGDDLVVVPANAGAARPPAWWLNLQAAGQGIATLGKRRRTVKPRIATGMEHERLWQRVAGVAPLDHYQRRSGRPLPIVVLERVPVPASDNTAVIASAPVGARASAGPRGVSSAIPAAQPLT